MGIICFTYIILHIIQIPIMTVLVNSKENTEVLRKQEYLSISDQTEIKIYGTLQKNSSNSSGRKCNHRALVSFFHDVDILGSFTK